MNLIRDRHPDQLQLPGFLWTGDAVMELIDQRFGVRLASRTVRRYLQSWGFTPQVPARQALERDPEAVKAWLEVEYPRVKRAAKRDRGIILWLDESGFRSECSHGRSYSPRGVTPVKRVTGKRFGTNMIAVIANDGHLEWELYDGRFNQHVFIAYLQRLIAHHGDRKIHLVLDRHPSHRSKLILAWVAEHKQRIVFHFLPGYSPELNPVELLNHDVKANAVGRKRPRTLAEMKQSIVDYLKQRKQAPHIIKRFFTHPSTAYAA